jgi:hypothetical protein
MPPATLRQPPKPFAAVANMPEDMELQSNNMTGSWQTRAASAFYVSVRREVNGVYPYTTTTPQTS